MQEKNISCWKISSRLIEMEMTLFMTFISVNQVIFGGEYLPFGDSFARQLTALYEGTGWPVPVVRMSVLGKYAGIQGMILLAREQYFRELCSR